MAAGHGRAHWLPDIIRDTGLPVEVVGGWEHRGKEPREWIAMTDHHTASSRRGGPRPSLSICTHGRGGRYPVPGPLANLVLDRNAIHIVVAAGAANHPGVSYLPLRGGISSGVKYWSLGREVELDGVGEPFPVGGAQYEAMIVANAAICTYLGIDPGTGLWDHKSIARPVGRKIDIRPYDLPTGRVNVARRMAGVGPNPQEFTVSEAQAIKDLIYGTNDKVDRLDNHVTRLEGQIIALAGSVARKATVVRDPRDDRAWIIDTDGRWHVPTREVLDVLVWIGQVAAVDQIPMADPEWLDGIPQTAAPAVVTALTDDT